MSIEERIRQFIRDELSFSGEQPLADNDSFLAEGIIDSMGAFELAAFVESSFGIKVHTAEIVVKNFDSVGQLAAFVRRKLAAAGQRVPVEATVAQNTALRTTAEAESPVSESVSNSTVSM